MGLKLPIGDEWRLLDNDINSQHYGRNFIFKFSYIHSKQIKNLVKCYCWSNYKQKALATISLYSYISVYLPIIINFLKQYKIDDLRELTNSDIDVFISYLNTLISSKGKVYSVRHRKKCLDTLKSIIRWGQIYMPNAVPKIEIFTGSEYTGVNSKIKIDFIPDDILEKINISLKNEENPYVKYGLLILQSTGMRIGDMLKLTTDCIKPHLISGYTLTWYEHKNRKQRKPLPIPNECAIAIEKLIHFTKDLRAEFNHSNREYIFIHKVSKGPKVGDVKLIDNVRMNDWLKKFVKVNDIRDANGDLYNLMSHQFRRTLATDMFSKSTDLKVIQEVLGHTCPTTTKKYYADIKDKERTQVFKNIGIIGNINKVDKSIIQDSNDLIWFKENKDKGARMEDGYCSKPCTDGKICERLLKRQKCYTCSRYITTLEYLDAHKNHLKSLEKQMKENIYGEHYAEHFLPTIEILKEIIKRLEEIKDDSN